MCGCGGVATDSNEIEAQGDLVNGRVTAYAILEGDDCCVTVANESPDCEAAGRKLRAFIGLCATAFVIAAYI